MVEDEKAIKCLIKSDLECGHDNAKAILNHIRNEQYEELEVIKGVFDEMNKEMPNIQ